jgi:MraZ protein
MLIGEYKHTLDPKKRIAVPAKWRKELGRKIVITHGLDNCLSVYPLKSWAGISEKLAGLSMGQSNTRGFNRFMFGGAVEAEIDNLGRVLIPDFLKDFAGLQTKAVWAGLHSHVEIWDEDRWTSYKKQIEGQADGLAQKLGEIGVI